MASLIYQGKINRQFWGKLIRQSTKKVKLWKTNVHYMLPGGGQFYKYLSNNITFFHHVLKE